MSESLIYSFSESPEEQKVDINFGLTSSLVIITIGKHLDWDKEELASNIHSRWSNRQLISILFHSSICTKKRKMYTPKWKSLLNVSSFQGLAEHDIIGETKRCLRRINSQFDIEEQTIMRCNQCTSLFMPEFSNVEKAIEWSETIIRWVDVYFTNVRPITSNYTATLIVSMAIEIVHNGCFSLPQDVKSKLKSYIASGLYCPARNGLATILLIIHEDFVKDKQISEIMSRADLAKKTIISLTNDTAVQSKKIIELQAMNTTLASDNKELSQLRQKVHFLNTQIQLIKDHSKQVMADTKLQLTAMRKTLEVNGCEEQVERNTPVGKTQNENNDLLTVKCSICLDSNSDMTMIALEPCHHSICYQCKSITTCPCCYTYVTGYHVIYLG